MLMPIPYRPLLVLLALLLGSAVFWGCDSGPVPTPPPGVTPGGAPARPTPPPAVVNGGGNPVAKVGDWTFSAASLKVYEFLPDPQAGAVLSPTLGTFTTVLVTATNNGTGAAQLALSDFQLTDSAGHTFTPHTRANTYYAGSKNALSPVDAAVPPGTAHRIGVVFDLPPGDTGLTLIIRGQAQLYLGTAIK